MTDPDDFATVRAALHTWQDVMARFGEWDDACFYFNKRAAPELQSPILMTKQADAALTLIEKRMVEAEEQRDDGFARLGILSADLCAIDHVLRGTVHDPDPLPPIFDVPGSAVKSGGRETTYGLVVGLLRERDTVRVELEKTRLQLHQAHRLTQTELSGWRAMYEATVAERDSTGQALRQALDTMTAERDTLLQRVAKLEEDDRQWDKESLCKLIAERDALRRQVHGDRGSLAQPLPDHVRVVPSEASDATAPHTAPTP